MMIVGGNNNLQRYFEENNIDLDSMTSLDQKYKIRECEKYREKVIFLFFLNILIFVCFFRHRIVKRKSRTIINEK